ncbi:MAG: tRNA (adenosine(37)-N6)-threonylcarbamoyltransferase complex dimerization subunit type 1 TsaB [Acidimicrobiales bacterium]|nr:tRNA (adenosine(37)-N6)-threonylcarbamoyltransferase complex dimerization subunit type 1 TsaB [Acidimicrobiales bacterium]
MITLALTSSTALVGVAVGTDGTVLAKCSSLTDRRHAEEMTPMVQAVLDEAGRTLADVDRIVVDVGPGRYTGMRVGITTAKTLAFALSVPVVSITSFELLALAAPDHRGPVFAVVDARRNQVFAANTTTGGPPLVMSPDELVRVLPAETLCVGDGADRYRDEFAAVAEVAPGIVPNVAAAALLTPDRSGEPGTEIQPLYLREPDAAINIKTRPGGDSS